MIFAFEKIHVDGRILFPSDALLRVVATFSITQGDEIVYRQEEFCVVEFAAQLARWLAHGLGSGVDFVYTSEESEVVGLVCLEHVGPDRWRLSTYELGLGERRIFEEPVSTQTLRGAARSFLARLYDQLPERAVVLRMLGDEGAPELLTLFDEVRTDNR